MKKQSIRGFTLIEIIIALAIIAAISAILVPTIFSYIRRAEKAATLANGKELYNICYTLVCEDDDAYKSFYTKPSEGRWPFYIGTTEGRAVTQYLPNDADSDKSKLYIQPKVIRGYSAAKTAQANLQDGQYLFYVVARVDGAPHPVDPDGKHTNDCTYITRIFHIWDYSDRKFDYFMNRLNERMELSETIKRSNDFPLKMPYNERDDGGMHDVVRWLLCCRVDQPEVIEIWAGDGYKGENGPVYRVFPRPHEIYGVG